MYSFFLGALAFVFSDRVRVEKTFLLLAAPALLFFNCKYTLILGTLAACYLALCAGFMDLRGFMKKRDLSYGVYLCGFPVQQTLWELFPALRVWWALDLAAVPITLGVAALSWVSWKKPALDLKRKVH